MTAASPSYHVGSVLYIFGSGIKKYDECSEKLENIKRSSFFTPQAHLRETKVPVEDIRLTRFV